MSTTRVSAILTALLAKGFTRENRDHIYLFFHYQGRKTPIFTFVSHNEKTADEWLMNRLAHQVRLTKAEFRKLVDCSLSGAEYAQLMLQRGHIRR